MSFPPAPTIVEIDRISALDDPVMRNLLITQSYHELSLALAERTGQEANWCTFATWASKQAGQTIRKEDLARALASVLGEKADERAARQIAVSAQRIGVNLEIERILTLMWKALDPEAAFTHSSDAVARGNQKVFAEIGREFARFFATCLPDTSYDDEKIARFCEGLHPGEPPDGQEYLRRAFKGYYRALFETEAKTRSELLLLANIEIGLHEQTRLQPEIVEALEAPVITPRTFTHNLIWAYFPEGGWLPNTVWFLLRSAGQLVGFDAAVEGYIVAARREMQFLLTETMMTIGLPYGNRLRLGEDLTAQFPPALQHIDNADLCRLLAEIDPTPDSTRQSGADYWGDLPDRLHFIVDLFRCYQTVKDLLEQPFSAEQTTALKDGRLPEGSL